MLVKHLFLLTTKAIKIKPLLTPVNKDKRPDRHTDKKWSHYNLHLPLHQIPPVNLMPNVYLTYLRLNIACVLLYVSCWMNNMWLAYLDIAILLRRCGAMELQCSTLTEQSWLVACVRCIDCGAKLRLWI
jgi:hypothetical protein